MRVCASWHTHACVCVTHACRPTSFMEAGFRPLCPPFVYFVPSSRTKPAFWINTRTAPGPSSQVLPSCRVRHPQYSKRLFVQCVRQETQCPHKMNLLTYGWVMTSTNSCVEICWRVGIICGNLLTWICWRHDSSIWDLYTLKDIYNRDILQSVPKKTSSEMVIRIQITWICWHHDSSICVALVVCWLVWECVAMSWLRCNAVRRDVL